MCGTCGIAAGQRGRGCDIFFSVRGAFAHRRVKRSSGERLGSGL